MINLQVDVEDVLEGLRQVFIAKFPAALAAVDARKPTQLNPFPPEWDETTQTGGYLYGERQNMPQMPALLFLPNTAKPQQEDYGWRRLAYACAIEAYYTDQDIETLERIMNRYAAAIDDVLRANQTINPTLATNVRGILDIESQFTAISKLESSLLQGVRVEFNVIVMTD